MAGLLKPRAAKILIGAIREQHPGLVIHVHTHDTAGTGVASMLECVHAGCAYHLNMHYKAYETNNVK